MDFAWSAEQQELYDRAHRFAREGWGRGVDRDARWRLAGEFGLLGLCVPAEYGGMALDALTTARVVEAVGRGSREMGLLFSACAHLFAAAMPVAAHGSEALRQEFLPRMCAGQWVGANAITEAEAGSDVFAMKTRAVRDGAVYRIDGAKSFVTNGPIADVVVVYAVTNPSHGYLGISAFAVPRATPGLSFGAPFHTRGLSGATMCPVYFEDCRVAAELRLGREGDGAAIFRASMAWERACLLAMYLGAMERQLDAALAHVKRRRQFGKALGRHQAVAHRIADMKVRLESARWLLYHACWMKDAGHDASTAIAMAKLAVSEAAVASGLDMMRLFGGVGVVEGADIDTALADALPSLSFSGTSEIQRDLIARGLGL